MGSKKMWGWLALFAGLVAIVFVVVYMFTSMEEEQTSERNLKLNEVLGHNKNLVEKNQSLVSKIEFLESQVKTLNDKVSTFEKEVDAVQEHCNRLRESQFSLQDQVSNKRPLIQLPRGAIQVEILHPSKPPPVPGYSAPTGLGKKSKTPKQKAN